MIPPDDPPGHAHAAVTLEDGVATLTVTDAGAVNVLSTPVLVDLAAALDELAVPAETGELRVLVLRGSGDRAFVAGADLREMRDLDRDGAEAFIRRLAGVCERVRLFPSPVIARLAGHCLGAGLELAAAADLRVAGPDASLGMPEVEVGIPSVIHAALLPGLVGTARANQLVLTGRRIDATTALAWGLVDEVAPAGGLDEAVGTLARRLAGFGPHALRAQKRLVREWAAPGVPAAVEASVAVFADAFDTGEPQEFMRRFG